MRKTQDLNPQFIDYATMLIKLFNEAIEHEKKFRVIVTLNKDNSADLVFIQILPCKELRLLECHFTLGLESMNHAHNKYRYNVAKIKL